MNCPRDDDNLESNLLSIANGVIDPYIGCHAYSFFARHSRSWGILQTEAFLLNCDSDFVDVECFGLSIATDVVGPYSGCLGCLLFAKYRIEYRFLMNYSSDFHELCVV